MKINLYILIACLLAPGGCRTSKHLDIYETGTLKIRKIAGGTYIHTSYLETETFGKVPCNGMIVANSGEAIVFDTPTDDAVSAELISWMEKTIHCGVVGVVATHFHADCLGGLSEFHRRGIPSYASNSTISLAGQNNETAPQNGFDNILVLQVGSKSVVNEFLGQGHTVDNIVSYYPEDKVLFGGCLVKSMDAGKGYLGDANVKTWSGTVRKVKEKYGEAEIIIPGHGNYGNLELLDYTIKMFEQE